METFYTLSSAAGMVRSNKFNDKADAICVATFRAEHLALPIKIYEHKELGEGLCVLVAMPDGSVEEPEGAGYKTFDVGNASSGATNSSEAYMLLSAYDEMPITTFYLKSDLSESLASEIEKALEVEMGLYDPKTLHAYTEDVDKIRSIESKLAEASVEVETVRDSRVQKQKLEAAADLVEAARKGHQMARASRMPELTVKAASKFGRDLKVNCYCEVVEGSNKSSPKIRVMADGTMLGEVKNEREASQLISDYAESSFAKYLKKEMA